MEICFYSITAGKKDNLYDRLIFGFAILAGKIEAGDFFAFQDFSVGLEPEGII